MNNNDNPVITITGIGHVRGKDSPAPTALAMFKISWGKIPTNHGTIPPRSCEEIWNPTNKPMDIPITGPVELNNVPSMMTRL